MGLPRLRPEAWPPTARTRILARWNDAMTPSNAAIFRQITDRHSTMAGVMSVPARKKCVACEKQRTVATGIESADGFVCNHCAKVRSAAQPQEGWNG